VAITREGTREVPGSAARVVAEYGAGEHELTELPLTFQGETVGALLIAPRGPGEPFTGPEVRLLHDLARHVAAVAYSVHLAADLQRSRQEILSVREEERRRIRRDLHDGLGPALASATLMLDAAGNVLRRQPDEADALLGQAAHQVREAVGGIRSLVYALRPPSLDELGLVGAIRDYAGQVAAPSSTDAAALAISVEAPADLAPLPAAVEVAAYRIATEALTNVVRHAGARHCAVRLSVAGGHTLVVEVTDDGLGIPSHHRPGVGLASMRERAAELLGTCTVERGPRGGTRVEARLPLPGVDASAGDERSNGKA
jgi:signal transduction histidine kinase